MTGFYCIISVLHSTLHRIAHHLKCLSLWHGCNINQVLNSRTALLALRLAVCAYLFQNDALLSPQQGPQRMCLWKAHLSSAVLPSSRCSIRLQNTHDWHARTQWKPPGCLVGGVTDSLASQGHLERVGEERCAHVRAMLFANRAMANRSNLEKEARNWIDAAGTTPPGNGALPGALG